MAMKTNLMILVMMLTGTFAGMAGSYDVYDDDIYYNPKKDTSASVTNRQQKTKRSNYIANFDSIDVDTYNRRGQYYYSPVDTIGSGAENGEDFVYSQMIQKYYNPTIVIDNAEILSDVLNNSYGNVNIEINNDGYPVFGSYYNPWPYYSPYYSSYWGPSWSWNWGYGGWSIGIGWYDPWYWDSWYPGWAWGPSWGWGGGWYPGWSGWYPGWGYDPHWSANHYRPSGNHRVGPGAGWSTDTRPGYNYNGGNRGHYGIAGSNTGTGSYSPNNHRGGGIVSTPAGYNGGTHRNIGNIGNTSVNGSFNTNRVNGTGNHRVGTSGSYNRNSSTYNGSNTNRGNTNRGNSYNNNGATHRNSGSYNSGSQRSSGSFNSGGTHRSGGFGGGSYGGGSRGGGGGGRSGGHR